MVGGGCADIYNVGGCNRARAEDVKKGRQRDKGVEVQHIAQWMRVKKPV